MPASGDTQNLAKRLTTLTSPVRLIFFTQTFGCDACLPARQVVDEVAILSEQITVEEYNLVLDKEQVAKFGVEMTPATAIVGEKDIGLRYYEVPEGYEASSFVDAVLLAAGGDTQLASDSLVAIAAVG